MDTFDDSFCEGLLVTLHCKKWHFETSRYIYVQLYK